MNGNKRLKERNEMTCKLEYWREKRGWTQTQLSERSNIPQPQISRYEGGQWPGHENLKKLAKALEIKVADLVGDENGNES